jgi:hypothetical protein
MIRYKLNIEQNKKFWRKPMCAKALLADALFDDRNFKDASLAVFSRNVQ